jgi:hypothetical protein
MAASRSPPSQDPHGAPVPTDIRAASAGQVVPKAIHARTRHNSPPRATPLHRCRPATADLTTPISPLRRRPPTATPPLGALPPSCLSGRPATHRLMTRNQAHPGFNCREGARVDPVAPMLAATTALTRVDAPAQTGAKRTQRTESQPSIHRPPCTRNTYETEANETCLEPEDPGVVEPEQPGEITSPRSGWSWCVGCRGARSPVVRCHGRRPGPGL